MSVIPTGGWHKHKRTAKGTERSQVACEPLHLSKHALQLGAQAQTPSPGALFGNRLVLLPRGGGGGGGAPDAAPERSARLLLASGARVYAADAPLPACGGGGRDGDDFYGGKDGTLLPVARVDTPLRATPLAQLPHRLEVQSLALAYGAAGAQPLLASVDAQGRAVVAALDGDAPCDAAAAASPRYAVAPPRATEPGWAGAEFRPAAGAGGAGGAPCLAVARHLGRCVDLYEADLHSRTLHTNSYPTAVRWLDTDTLATAERGAVTVFDVRAGERGGVVARASPSSAPLYALDVLPTAKGTAAEQFATGGLLGVSGADRSVHVLDVRTWGVRSRWTQCLKFEVTALRFSPSDPRCVYVAGLDSEVCLGQWDLGDGARAKDAQRAAFRGEGAFLGLDVVAATKDADLALAWWDTNALLTAGLSVAGPPPVFPEHGGERGRRQGSNSAGKEGGGKKNARQQ